MTPLSPSSVIGILGGGQLGKYLSLSAKKFGYKTLIIDPNKHCPASSIANEFIHSSFDDIENLIKFAQKSDVIIPEFENIPQEIIKKIEQYAPLFPNSDLIKTSQNRGKEKKLFQSLDILTPPFLIITKDNFSTIELSESFFPGILKTSQFGYDGKGQISVATEDEYKSACQKLFETSNELILEKKINFLTEFSLIMAKDKTKKTCFLPVPENHHDQGILDYSIIPGNIPEQSIQKAKTVIEKIANHFSIIGLFCVEFFLIENGDVMANEIAPRVHNSGHYSIDHCSHSQFDLAITSATGFSIPNYIELLPKKSFMLNLLGHENYFQNLVTLKQQVPSSLIHNYGKIQPKEKRKMGHVTFSSTNLDQGMMQIQEIKKQFYLPGNAIKA